MLIDSHCHLDSSRYAEDLEPVLRRAAEAGVGAVLAIGIGENPTEMGQALEICREFNARPDSGSALPRIYASAGVYPHETPSLDDAALARLDALLSEPEVIACGEIGLDYFYDGAPHDLQRRQLIPQLEVAAARRRPILIHCRPKDGGAPIDRSSSMGWKDGATDAWEDLFSILDEHWRPTGLGGVMHCFSAGLEQAHHAFDLGFLVSFAGNLSFPKAEPLRQVAAALPLDRLLVETDAPYLAPVPHRGQRNEPAWVAETARLLASLQHRDPDDVAQTTTKNFFRLFGLEPIVGN